MPRKTLITTLLILMTVPLFVFPGFIAGLDPYQHRMLGILLLAIVLWISEVIPGYATGLVIILLQLLFLSDKGVSLFLNGPAPLNSKAVMASFASPIIILFLGGFSIAATANKYKLDRSMAKAMLKPFGTRPATIMLGLMLITAVFSMFMSNTATTAMMLAILAPVLSHMSDADPAKKSFLLCVPVAANIGGMGTPIGTPPNAIAMKYLTGADAVSFGAWMAFGVPIVAILVALSWWLLLVMYRPQSKELRLQIKTSAVPKSKQWIFYGTFALTVALWLTGKIHGMNTYVVAMVPLTVFFVTRMLDKTDIRKFSWEVLWLIAGGISLGDGMSNSGLSQSLIDLLPTESMTPVFLISVLTVIAFLMGNFISHTVAANVMLPLVATVVTGFANEVPMKGAIVQVALVCSLGMALPISTPPNALAFATGKLDTRDILRTGGLISVIGLALVWLVSLLL